jgi:poly(beta-D-mannuronate) lyase
LKKIFFSVIYFFLFISISNAEQIKVKTIAELQMAINKAVPGDRIVVANGIYTTEAPINISKTGTAEKPITIEAEKIGGVEINGTNGFIIASTSSFIIIKGFRFTHRTGTNSISPGATHCIITRNLFECSPANAGTKPYLNISGDDNEVSYNTFLNKLDEGQMVSVQGPGGDRMAKRTWIHHNYFYNFPPKANNCSAIQIGLSGRSMDSAFCIVEYNLFIKTAGENEGAVCNKSCNNIFRFNTFGEGTEELSLRHGNKCQVYGNFFLGSTGLRFSGDDHKIFSNYFKGCREAIVCTNGDGEVKEGSKLTCHDRPDRVQVLYNTMVDCKNNFRQPERANGLGSTFITFEGNIISGGNPVSISGKYLHPLWKGNIIWKTAGGDLPASGYNVADPQLSDKIFMIDRFGKLPAGLRPLTVNDVGPQVGTANGRRLKSDKSDVFV